MPQSGKTYRVTADGAQAQAEFKKTGDAGAAMAERVVKGAKSVPPALRLVDAAASEAKASVQGLVAQVGPAGTVIAAMGPAGVAAAAGVGLLIGAFAGANKAAHDMRDLQRAAASVGGDVEQLQEWRAVLQQAGGDITGADRALQGLSEKLGELSSGVGLDAAKNLRAIGFSDAEIARMTSVKEALPLIAERLANLGDAAQRTAIAKKLGIADLLPALNQGAAAMERARVEAHKLGLVLDESVVKNGAEAATQLDVAGKVIGNELTSALLDLAPLLTATAKSLADVAHVVGDIYDEVRKVFGEVEGRSTQKLEAQLKSVQGRIDAWRKQNPNIDREAAPTSQFADAIRERHALVEELQNRRLKISASAPAPSARAPAASPLAKAADAETAALNAQIEALRKTSAERLKLESIEWQFPGILEAEAKERVALSDTMADIETARAKGVISSDAEAASLKAIAQANFDAGQAVRDRAQAMADSEAAQQKQIELEQAQTEAAARLQSQLDAAYTDWRDIFSGLAAGGQQWEATLLRIADQVIPKLVASVLHLGQAQESVTGKFGAGDLISSAIGALIGPHLTTFGQIAAPLDLPGPVFGGGAQGNPIGMLSYAGGRAAGGWVNEGQFVDVGENGPETMGVIGGRAFVRAGAASPAKPVLNVTIINQTPARVETRQDESGNLQVLIRQEVSRQLVTGEQDKPMFTRFGVKPKIG